MNNTPSVQNENKSALIWVIVAGIYIISPVDLVPLFAGDDILVGITAGLNMIQSQLKESNEALASLIKIVKFAILGIGIIVLLLLGLLTTTIVQLFN